MAESRSTVIPALRYRDAPAAIEWLCSVLGFTRHAVYEGAGGVINHAELALGGGMIMLGSMKENEKGKENNRRKKTSKPADSRRPRNWVGRRRAARISWFPMRMRCTRGRRRRAQQSCGHCNRWNMAAESLP